MQHYHRKLSLQYIQWNSNSINQHTSPASSIVVVISMVLNCSDLNFWVDDMNLATCIFFPTEVRNFSLTEALVWKINIMLGSTIQQLLCLTQISELKNNEGNNEGKEKPKMWYYLCSTVKFRVSHKVGALARRQGPCARILQCLDDCRLATSIAT